MKSDTPEAESVGALEHEIRDLFNIERRHRELRENAHDKFNQAVASLDVIGDTELALRDYERSDPELGQGMRYIATYGVLQALFLQQDAITDLGKSLGIKTKLPSTLWEIRNIRNDVTGHPTARNRDGSAPSFHHISRATMSRTGFDVLTTYANSSELEMNRVDLNDVLHLQSEFAADLLLKIRKVLLDDEQAHKEEFMNDPLSSIFPQTTSYLFQQIWEDIFRNYPSPMAQADLKTIKAMIDSFDLKVRERKEDTQNVLWTIEETERPLERLNAYFNEGQEINQQDLYIYLDFLKSRVELLTTMAREIDEIYRLEN